MPKIVEKKAENAAITINVEAEGVEKRAFETFAGNFLLFVNGKLLR